MEDRYIEDLKEIKDILHRSSRFISLSGLSGVAAGICALLGYWIATNTVFTNNAHLGYQRVQLPGESMTQLLMIAGGTLVLAIVTAVYFTTRETRKRNQSIWDHQSKRLLINLGIPLVTGGILCLILLIQGYIGLLAPLTLIFYGLGLVNASKYTLPEIRSLGIIEIILGLAAMQFIGQSMFFWMAGFGVLHIIYGLHVQRKYKS